ncbi:hypothetical protein [Methylobacterium sp. J-068]|uniref:hypothetical protein n=1 Tax=Methylobacterium sp. J-068 TaxID=2836649 RepID=UPI001FBBCB1C|nr:hypothetical protein [Methylobacterium sp. J-068]MCJ2037044.1 hypothetical protein [Methylobacterium sp. J-068]
MRMHVLGALLSLGLIAQSAMAQPVSHRSGSLPAGEPAHGDGAAGDLPGGDLQGLERAWHDCVRAAFARQPRGLSRAASERSALDECQAGEDATVAAAMRMAGQAAGPGTRRGLTERARAWAASVAAEVIDPVSSWFAGLRR